MELVRHQGGCHCGAVRFAFEAPARVEVLDCNCSICRMTGFQHLIVPAERFTLLKGADFLAEYRFNSGVARHRFCRNCGVKSFYVPRSHPDGFSINLRCVDAGTLEDVAVVPFDDGNRAVAMAELARRSGAD